MDNKSKENIDDLTRNDVDAECVLSVKDLSKKYEKKCDFAVEDISFDCYKGQIVGLLGGNGAGKSTTLKCITGMISLTKGSVRICGYDMESQALEAKKSFSFVTDNHFVFTKLTGIQYLSFMADVYRVPTDKRKAIYQKLEEVFQLGSSANRLISSYSHGMKQKICMMGSLLHEPVLWVLDEPMLGLDPPTQKRVLEFMRSYSDLGNTILFSSHNLDIVPKICERILIIENGKLASELDVTDEMRINPDVLGAYYSVNDAEVEAEG